MNRSDVLIVMALVVIGIALGVVVNYLRENSAPSTLMPTVQYTSGVPHAPVSVRLPAPALPPSVYYPNCDAVRAAGQAPLYRDSPGYRPGLDHNGDGVACEGR